MNSNPKKFSACLWLKIQQLPNKRPDFLVMLNNTKQSATTANDDMMMFELTADFGDNVLTVDLCNKDSMDTWVNDQGQITHDLAVQMQKLTVDNLDITDQIKQHMTYLTCDSELANTYGYMHKNGRLTMQFQCPVFYYLRNSALVEQTS